jgi:hypothetical protein
MGDFLEPHEVGPVIRSYLRGEGDVAWRIEQLPAYAVTSDGDDFRRWQAGELEPTWERKQLNFDVLAQRAANGIRSERVRIFTPELTEYERYACEWGYALNGPAGEDIRVLHRGEHRIPPLLGFDYWLLNDTAVIRMHYDEVCRRERAALWAAAEPFDTWYARHPELQRRLAA